MNRGARRWPTFLDDHDRRMFLFILAEAADRYGVEIHSYCLMSNHYHLLLRCPDDNVSDFMRYVGSLCARRFNRHHGVDGPLYRGRFRSKVIEEDGYLIAVVRYIARNPLALLGGAPLHTYRWSSHRFTAGAGGGPQLLTTSAVLQYFDNDAERYRAFVEGIDTPVADYVIERDVDPNMTTTHIPLSSIERVVCELAQRPLDTLQAQGRGARQPHLVAVLILASQLSSATTAEVARRYGYAEAATVRSAVSRGRRKLGTEQTLTYLVEDATSQLLANAARRAS